jgi:signal transduction histidine kinase/ActR/RegA family two-component response regulator
MTSKRTVVPLGTLLAVTAALAAVVLFVIGYRSYNADAGIFQRHQSLFRLKKNLVDMESELIRARLDESRLIAEQSARYSHSFEEHTAMVRAQAKEHFLEFDDAEINKPLLILVAALDRYRESVKKIVTLQQEMGLDGESGYLTQIAKIEQGIHNRLQRLERPELGRQFADVQIQEREFRRAFDRHIASNLLGQTSAVSERVKEAKLDPAESSALSADLEHYHEIVSKQLARALELEAVVSESGLHFERLLPHLTTAQRRVDSDLAVLLDASRKQRTSLLLVILALGAAFVLMSFLILVQMWRERRAIMRMRSLAAIMHEVAEGNLAQAGEADLPPGNDEVGSMAESLATMAAQIQSQRDIIERERARAEEGEQTGRDKARLLAKLSHEIRSSLSGVVGLLELLEQTGLSSEQASYSGVIRSNSDALMALAQDVDEQAKPELGMIELNQRKFSLTECIDSALGLFRPRAMNKGLELERRMAASVPDLVIGDDTRLRKILHHLVVSAIKIARSGKVSVLVQLISRTDSKVELRFMIQLQGAGIPAEEMEAALQPVIRTEAASKVKDGGGLSVCAELVEMMGGRIWTQSEGDEDMRVCFTVRLESAEVPGEASPDRERAASISHTLATDLAERIPLRILLVEDTQVNQMLMTRIFEKMGYTLDIAKNGREAVERARDAQYDLILMDIQMPEMDGWEASSIILQEADREHRPRIVAVTANASEENRQRCMTVGMDDFVSKPFTLKRMQAVVEQWGHSQQAGA